MNYKNATLLIICTLSLFACDKSAKTFHFPNIITIDINDRLAADASEVFESITFLPLLTDEIIGDIQTLKIIDNKILLYDGQMETISLYNMDGTFINKIDNKGRGPSEYRDISDYNLLDDRIFLLTNRRNIDAYSIHGEFIERSSFPMFIDKFHFHDDKLILLSEESEDMNRLFIINQNMEVEKTLLPYNDKAAIINFWPPQPINICSNDVMWVYIPEHYGIFRYSNQEIIPEYQIQFKGIKHDISKLNYTKINHIDLPVVHGTFFIDNYIITQFMYKNTLYQHIYSVFSKESKLFKGVELRDDINDLMFLICYFRGTKGNTLYSSMPAELFTNFQDFQETEWNSCQDGNDVLVAFKLKSF